LSAWAGPDVGDGRCPGGPLSEPRVSEPRVSEPHVSEPQSDEPPMFAAGPNPTAEATAPRKRQQTEYRGLRQVGRLMAVRYEGAA